MNSTALFRHTIGLALVLSLLVPSFVEGQPAPAEPLLGKWAGKADTFWGSAAWSIRRTAA